MKKSPNLIERIEGKNGDEGKCELSVKKFPNNWGHKKIIFFYLAKRGGPTKKRSFRNKVLFSTFIISPHFSELATLFSYG